MMEQEFERLSPPPSRRPWRPVAMVLLALILVVVSFAGGVATTVALGPRFRETLVSAGARPNAAETGITREEGFSLLGDVWDLLQREYYDPKSLDNQKMIYGAASGLASSLKDPHTVFVEPLPAAIMNQDMQGSFEGIGATVDMVDGKLVIVRPLPDSPALRAGLKEGDIILKVDDTSLEGKTLVEGISLIRGPRGTTVRLLVQREGAAEPFVITVTREKVELTTVEWRMLDNNIGYLRLTEFNAVSTQKVRDALRELMRADPAGLILDLRGNPGGYLQMAIDIASEFLPRGTLIMTEQERDQPVQEYHVKGNGAAVQVPLVVLINGGSASASEIVAGAIRDNERGTLIGEKSYGKGSVQNTHELEDGSSLRVTIAKWSLPKGENLDGNGLEPQIVAPLTSDDMKAGRDPQLDRAQEFLLQGK